MTNCFDTEIKVNFQCKKHETNARLFYGQVLVKLQQAGINTSDICDSKTLLCRAGFSQNSRNRITRLSEEEIRAICKSCPIDQVLWNFYVNEIQWLLIKMDQVRKIDSFLGRPPFMGRPYVTGELASTINKLTRLRYLYEKGTDTLRKSKMRECLVRYDGEVPVTQFLDDSHSANGPTGEAISIQSAIRLLELYRDEMIMPPRMVSRMNFEDDILHMIETENFSWMDDAGKSFLEDICDMPLVTHYDELPKYDSVVDWFIATKPVLGKEQIKRGWAYLEEMSDEWHQRDEFDYFSEEFISEYPSWNCMIEDHSDEWLATFPLNNPYKLVPLTTPQKLLEESKRMHHCVVTYLESCISGEVRIFSVCDTSANQRIATAELSQFSGKWEIVQLKGKHNQELIHRVRVPSDPLAIILEKLASWYNARASIESFAQA